MRDRCHPHHARRSAGCVVCGTTAHTPGSICRPSPLPCSAICCRYVMPNMMMSGWSRPRFGISPLMALKAKVSVVRLSSRNRSLWEVGKWGRHMLLSPVPSQSPTSDASGPRLARGSGGPGVGVGGGPGGGYWPPSSMAGFGLKAKSGSVRLTGEMATPCRFQRDGWIREQLLDRLLGVPRPREIRGSAKRVGRGQRCPVSGTVRDPATRR